MRVFCDWISIIVPLQHRKRVCGGVFAAIDEFGDEEFTTFRWKKLENPSHSTTVSVRSVKVCDLLTDSIKMETFEAKTRSIMPPMDSDCEFDALEISGNPTKFLSGANIWGDSDIAGTVDRFISAILQKINLEPSDLERAKIQRGIFMLSRIDLTTNIKFKNRVHLGEVLTALQKQAHSRYQKANSVSSSAYFGKSSKIKSLVFYDKLEELKIHKSKLAADKFEIAAREASTLMRAELRLKSQFFARRMIYTLKDFFDKIDAENILKSELERLGMGQLTLTEGEAIKLTRELSEKLRGDRSRIAVLGAFRGWLAGSDIRDEVSRNTYAKYAKKIKALIGVDIKSPRLKECKQTDTTAAERVSVVSLNDFIADRLRYSEPSEEYERAFLRRA